MGVLDSLNLGGLLSGFGTVKSMASAFFIGIVGFVLACIFGWLIYRWIKDKTFYTIPCSLTVLTENGMEKTRHDLKGGSYFNKGLKDFKIKIPKAFKPFILGYVPDFSMSNTTDGRLSFITSGDRTIWQQYKTIWIQKETQNINGKMFEYDLIKKPIPKETKQIAVNAIKNWRDTVDKAKLTAWGIAIGAFIIMVIAHLISLYIQTRVKCGTG